MNPKYWCVVFIFLLCTDQVRMASTTGAAAEAEAFARSQTYPCPGCRPPPGGCRDCMIPLPPRPPPCRYGNCGGGGCFIPPRLERLLDQWLYSIQGDLYDTYPLQDSIYDSYQLTGGSASGFRNFRRTRDYQCVCLKDRIKIVIEVSFLRIVLNYTLSILEDLLGGLLGNLGTAVGNLLGNVVNLVINLLALDIRVQVVIVQAFIPGSRCYVESFQASRVSQITLLNLDLSFLADLLSGLLLPVVNLVLNILIGGQIRGLFVRKIGQLVIPFDLIVCLNKPRLPYWG